MRDLKPYVCTFEECDVKMFTDRHTWFTHELQTHRVEWRCCFCTHVPYQSLPIFQKHLRTHTGKFTEDRFPAIVKICQQPLDRIPATACPFCDYWEPKLREVNKHMSVEEILVVTPQQFRHHVGAHMEQLALFAIPRGYKEDGDAESGLAVPGHGSDASSEGSLVRPDYEDDDNPRIHVAAFEGLEDEVKELLGPEWNPEVLYSQGKTWGSVLAAAAASGHLSIADFILKNCGRSKFTFFPQTSKRWTPLHWAASNGHLEMTKLLLDHAKSDTAAVIDNLLSVRNIDTDGFTALDLARQYGHDDVVKLLEDSYAESTDDLSHNTFLNWSHYLTIKSNPTEQPIMSATFCVFSTEYTAGATLPLLGRLVADPRRPLLNYRPTIDIPQQPDQKSPVIDIVTQKSTTMSTEAIKKTIKLRYSITADELKTYSLRHVSDAWKTVMEANDMELTNFVKENKGKAYFMVSIKTAIKPSVVSRRESQKSGGLKGSVPLAAVTSGAVPALLGDPHVGIDVRHDSTTNIKAVLADEIAFAAEYRVIALVSEYKMSLKKLISRKQFLEDKGVLEQFGRGRRAFSGNDEDSDVEDDDDDDENFM